MPITRTQTAISAGIWAAILIAVISLTAREIPELQANVNCGVSNEAGDWSLKAAAQCQANTAVIDSGCARQPSR